MLLEKKKGRGEGGKEDRKHVYQNRIIQHPSKQERNQISGALENRKEHINDNANGSESHK